MCDGTTVDRQRWGWVKAKKQKEVRVIFLPRTRLFIVFTLNRDILNKYTHTHTRAREYQSSINTLLYISIAMNRLYIDWKKGPSTKACLHYSLGDLTEHFPKSVRVRCILFIHFLCSSHAIWSCWRWWWWWWWWRWWWFSFLLLLFCSLFIIFGIREQCTSFVLNIHEDIASQL